MYAILSTSITQRMCCVHLKRLANRTPLADYTSPASHDTTHNRSISSHQQNPTEPTTTIPAIPIKKGTGKSIHTDKSVTTSNNRPPESRKRPDTCRVQISRQPSTNHPKTSAAASHPFALSPINIF